MFWPGIRASCAITPASLSAERDAAHLGPTAAAVDGATPWQRLLYVTLPVLKPVLVVIVMLRGIFMFNKFDIVWLLTAGGPLSATEHLPILAYQKTFRMFDIGGGAAIATSIFLFLTLVIWLYFKLFPLEETA